MFNMFLNISMESWNVLTEMSPYLLFGFLVAGILYVFISQEKVEKHLGGKGIIPIILASLLGVPLPLCSCGVIPVSASLRKNGASKAATTSFLLSTPQTGIDSILVTYGMLGGLFAVYRPLVAFLSGIFGGLIVRFFDKKTDDLPMQVEINNCCENGSCNIEARKKNNLLEALKYGFIVLPGDIGRAMLIGIILAGIISTIVPDDYFSGLFKNDFLTMIIMMLVGIPVYVCATASVPIAASLIIKGISPGAALVFLMTGPATNAAAISTIWKIMGKRVVVIYLASVAAFSMIAGTILNLFIEYKGDLSYNHMNHNFMLPDVVKQASAVILLSILIIGFVRSRSFLKKKKNDISDIDKSTIFYISGMKCTHCAASIKKEVEKQKNIVSTDIDLKNNKAYIKGSNIDIESIKQGIEDLGYKVYKVEESMSNQIIKIIVPDMTCNHCAESIRKSVGKINGVSSLEVNLSDKEVVIKGNNLDNEILKKAIENSGFTVKGIVFFES
ncbi:MAG: SO_0444 family Cu/Zn efflux transporter [Candidatus Coatesbacteria bacterium]|nr:SO_0444 family Cu/Zn efflux transporter [Candidatus Coatesbacteria bacterium]